MGLAPPERPVRRWRIFGADPRDVWQAQPIYRNDDIPCVGGSDYMRADHHDETGHDFCIAAGQLPIREGENDMTGMNETGDRQYPCKTRYF